MPLLVTTAKICLAFSAPFTPVTPVDAVDRAPSVVQEAPTQSAYVFAPSQEPNQKEPVKAVHRTNTDVVGVVPEVHPPQPPVEEPTVTTGVAKSATALTVTPQQPVDNAFRGDGTPTAASVVVKKAEQLG